MFCHVLSAPLLLPPVLLLPGVARRRGGTLFLVAPSACSCPHARGGGAPRPAGTLLFRARAHARPQAAVSRRNRQAAGRALVRAGRSPQSVDQERLGAHCGISQLGWGAAPMCTPPSLRSGCSHAHRAGRFRRCVRGGRGRPASRAATKAAGGRPAAAAGRVAAPTHAHTAAAWSPMCARPDNFGLPPVTGWMSILYPCTALDSPAAGAAAGCSHWHGCRRSCRPGAPSVHTRAVAAWT